MNWLNLLYLLPLAGLYWLFLSSGRGYRLIHKNDQTFSSPELRFRYTADDLSAYFSGIENQQELTRIWRWKYAATAVFLLVMVGITFNFDLPLWLRSAMIVVAALRALLAFLETPLLLSLQRDYRANKPLLTVKAASLITSLKWCVTGLWLLGLFGFLMVRAVKMSA